jgi:hypothetical protein
MKWEDLYHILKLWNFNILVTKPQRRILIGRPSRSWESNIKTDFRKIVCESSCGCETVKLKHTKQNFLT